jgi:hypothetical protein
VILGHRMPLNWLVVAVLVALALAFAAAGQGTSASRQDHSRSDRFWQMLQVHGVEAEHYQDLRTMTQSSDAVVLGRIQGLDVGREVRDLESEAAGQPRIEASVFFAVATVHIDEVLAGDSVAGSSKTISLELLLAAPARLPQLKANTPRERAVYFLRDNSAYAKPPGGLYRLVSSQGLLREFDGSVYVAVEIEDQFPRSLEGTRFAEVLGRIRSFAR